MPSEVRDDAEWVTALDDPTVQWSPSLAGYPRGRVRMASDWDTSERVLDVHLIYACRRGRIAACLGGIWQPLAAGGICLVPPDVSFRFQAQAQPVVARFRLRVAQGGRELAWGRAARIATMDATLERLVDVLVDELHDGTSPALTSDLARAFCRAFIRAEHRTTGAGEGRSRLTADQLSALASEVARRPCAITPRDLARHLGLSHDWSSRLIRAATGVPPRAWIVRERMRLACHMLGQDLAPAEVAQRLGYRDPRLFGRQFRAVLGCPPGAWRRRQRRE